MTDDVCLSVWPSVRLPVCLPAINYILVTLQRSSTFVLPKPTGFNKNKNLVYKRLLLLTIYVQL